MVSVNIFQLCSYVYYIFVQSGKILLFFTTGLLCSSDTSPKKIYKAAVVNPNVTAYSIHQVADILSGSKEEIRLLSKMRHENIIALFGVVYGDRPEDTLPLLVMEGVQCDLFYYLNNTALFSWHDDLIILQGICGGLAYLHMGKGIIHNNISTHTILLTKDMVVKISNFEYAVKIHGDVNKATCYSSDLLSLGEVISTILGLKYSGTLTTDKESIKELMVSMNEMCTNTQSNNDITSYDILKALNDHKK